MAASKQKNHFGQPEPRRCKTSHHLAVSQHLRRTEKLPPIVSRPNTPPEAELTVIAQQYSLRNRPTLTSSVQQHSTRQSQYKNFHPLEVSAVSSTADCAKNASSRSICNRYSIDPPDHGAQSQMRCHSQSDSRRCFSAATRHSKVSVHLPPITEAKSYSSKASNEDQLTDYKSDFDYDEYLVIKQTLFSKVVYKVRRLKAVSTSFWYTCHKSNSP